MPTKKNPDLIDSLVAEWRRERPQTTPEAMQVVGRIIRLGRLFEEQITRMLRPHELSYSDFDVLATLRRSGAPYEQSPTELQKNVLLTSGAMTACLRRLESAGLVSRKGEKADRRRLTAKLTAAGHAMVERLIDQRFDVAQAAMGDITPTQFAELERLLRRLGP